MGVAQQSVVERLESVQIGTGETRLLASTPILKTNPEFLSIGSPVQGNGSIDFRLLYYDELKPKVLPQSSVVGCLSLWSNPDPDLAQTARRADLSPSRRKSEMHPVVRRKDMTLALDF